MTLCFASQNKNIGSFLIFAFFFLGFLTLLSIARGEIHHPAAFRQIKSRLKISMDHQVIF